MTILNLPTLTQRGNATQCSFNLMHNTQVFESPLNRTVQTYELPGARWLFTATWENLCEADARIMKAWLASLRGMAGRFYARDLAYRGPRGGAVGSGHVDGAGQSGGSVNVAWDNGGGYLLSVDNSILTVDDETYTLDENGLLSPISGWLLPGDYVGINGELKIITAPATLSGFGVATLSFEPPLRSIPLDAAPVIISPTAVFRLNDDKQDGFGIDPDRHPSITISASEVFS